MKAIAGKLGKVNIRQVTSKIMLPDDFICQWEYSTSFLMTRLTLISKLAHLHLQLISLLAYTVNIEEKSVGQEELKKGMHQGCSLISRQT